ncbi:glycosyltransferase family 2 protein [Psychroserpens luteolus]|uniref:glycosyltransferase family 2 protein n=1 Tax=Psychroserpens luteolus TaxID=2855840 RepID=UPI001E2F739A|nr:glycosyltransferase family 2 protein [Psychroserpens luteolus]MCD2260845.1 glycosyltransferase family 2 protein [Psychroserpens luteolus]
MIDVSCILINYNTSQYTIDCIKSIIDNTQNSISYEIVVIDNASRFEDYSILKTQVDELNAKQVKLIRSKLNVGFGAGNMLGVQYAEPCKYYAFINNDTLQVSENCLYHLKAFMDQTTDAGVCSPQMLDEHKKFRVTIDHFSSIQREILRRPLLETLFPSTYLNRKKTYDKPTKVHYVQGSFMFIDAKDFDDIGGFDTNLFLYYEESDVSRRLLKQKNKFTYLIPDLEYIHYKSASIKKNIHIKIEQKIALLYYIKKHFGWLHHKILIVYYSIRYFFTSIIKPSYWKLFYIFLIGAPLSKSLKQRQKINQH